MAIRRRSMKLYAMYRGEECLCTGTADEISEQMNIKKATLWFYGSPTYRKRLESRKRGPSDKQRIIVCIGKEDDEEELI